MKKLASMLMVGATFAMLGGCGPSNYVFIPNTLKAKSCVYEIEQLAYDKRSACLHEYDRCVFKLNQAALLRGDGGFSQTRYTEGAKRTGTAGQAQHLYVQKESVTNQSAAERMLEKAKQDCSEAKDQCYQEFIRQYNRDFSNRCGGILIQSEDPPETPEGYVARPFLYF